MDHSKKKLVFRLSGHLLTIGAPLTATLTQFPIWVSGGSKQTVCGVALVLMLLSAIPAYKALKDKLRSPSAFLVWLILFILVATLKPIIEQLYVVALVGVVSGGGGTILYKLAEHCSAKTVKKKEDPDETG